MAIKKNGAPAEEAATSERLPPTVRLLSKPEVLQITGRTYPTIWAWMRAGTFPRSRMCGSRTVWLSTDIEAWLTALPVRPLKGDAVKAADEARAS
jgi:predicted DNA-binding transcriptional regulator AlpA